MDSKKRLFFWDLSRYLLLFLVFYPLVQLDEPDLNHISGWITAIGASELLTNDGHVWGDFHWILTGNDMRGQIWLFSMLFVVFLDYLWAFRGSAFAMRIRIANWAIAFAAYAGYTLFFPLSQRYDYFIYLYVLSETGWQAATVFLVLLSVAMMWLGVILADGYLIFRSLEKEDERLFRLMPVLLSLGIPGAGQIARGRYRRGAIFALLAVPVWAAGLFLHQVPTILFWAYAAHDARKFEGA